MAGDTADPRGATMFAAPSLAAQVTMLGQPEQLDKEREGVDVVLQRGDLVDRYVIVSTLGEGGMGIVYVAYDPELDRRVALKLLRSELGSLESKEPQARLLREAQALARLSHPNVVTIFDVGTLADQVWLAMELIEGQTLKLWLRQSRSWPQLVAVFVAAGRGLQAAHEVGLVHRDFKPENVMVGADGRVRVMDFGLACAEGGVIPVDPGRDLMMSTGTRLSDRMTQPGTLQGTPAYMAPEQWTGGVADARTDQFAFCVGLFEALYGVHPFASNSRSGIRSAVTKGEVAAIPGSLRVPGRLGRILRRGLAVQPGERWPNMTLLLAELEHDPRRTPLRVAGVAGLLIAASAVSYGVARHQEAEREGCEVVSRELAGVWDDERRAALRRAFTGTQEAFAADVWSRVEVRIDAYSEGLAGEQRALCEAHASGAVTDRLMDLRAACLGRQKTRLAALLDVFAAADRVVVENAVQAVASLPSIAACADAEALLAVAPPSDPLVAARVEGLREQLAQVEALEHAGRYEQGISLVTTVRAEAEALGYAPLAAEAAHDEGNLLLGAVRPAEAQARFAQALRLALVSDMHALAADAMAKQIFVVSDGLRRPAEALMLRDAAEALVERAHDDGRLEALLHNNLGVAYYAQGDSQQGQEQFARVVAAAQRVDPPVPLLAVGYFNLGEVHLTEGRLAASRANYTQARDLFARLVGESHPMFGQAVAGIGAVDVKAGAFAAALQHCQQALEILEATHGPDHMYVIQPLLGLARAQAGTGDTEAARATFERLRGLAERLPLVHPMAAEAFEGVGEFLASTGDVAGARALFERAVAVYVAAQGRDHGPQAPAAVRAGELAAQAGELAAAEEWFKRVLALARVRPEVRAAAALGLAKLLATRADQAARVCELLREASALAVTDPRRGEVEALRVASCPEGQGRGLR